MDKKVLSVIPRQSATEKMIKTADRLDGFNYFVTAELIEEGTIVMIHVYQVSKLKKGKRNAEFRTFLSKDDYINQELNSEKVHWFTSSFSMMNDFNAYGSLWNNKTKKWEYHDVVYFRSKEEKEVLSGFFKEYSEADDKFNPWSAVYRFQEKVKEKRLEVRHKKETDPIDQLMNTVSPVPKVFEEWVWKKAMSFSQYLIYDTVGKNTAKCECTCCKKMTIVDRRKVRLRNNEKGTCPNCGEPVTFKALGRMSARITDDRWVAYIDPREDGFIWRYFHAIRSIYREKIPKTQDYMYEGSRNFYTFQDGKQKTDSYEYTTYRQTGHMRWCHDNGRVSYGFCVLYPGNLPEAWQNTPYKYSALEILATNAPTKALCYEWGLNRFMEFPALEWMIKMGLNRIAEYVINEGLRRDYSKRLNFSGKTIYDILKLNKVDTRILQEIDGNTDELRLLQVAEQIGMQFKADQLREYYETFECNTELIKKTKRKVSLHRLVKYIAKESENYPRGDYRGWVHYGAVEKKDPQTERKQNMARDWLEYIGWCRELKYDLDNMFVYMPKNFKKVHDRTAKEYQALQDKKAADKRKQTERALKKKMEQIKTSVAEILETNANNKDAFSLKGKGLILVVPRSADDIRAEGEALHHCVGTYVERVARGETFIFFIRKQDEPDKSYYTMEWKDGKVVQCRGMNNRDATPQVKAFVEAFKQKMSDCEKKPANTRRVG